MIQIYDYMVFGAFLLLSISVGAFHALKAKNVKESHKTDNFLMGDRKMPVGPISLSLLTTFLSGITLLGNPAEIYQRGLLFWILFLSGGLSLLISGYVFVPTFHKLRLVSIYQYFELRFNSRLLRQLASLMFMLNTLLYMAVVIYAPAVALNKAIDVPLWPFILFTGLSCTLYTSIGGLKAVVWTDTLQAIAMYTGLGVLIGRGIHEAGGFKRIFSVAYELGHVNALWRIDPNPAQHNSLWISIFGGISSWLSLYGLNQMAMQRYCSLPTIKDALTVVWLTIPAFLLLSSLASFVGLVALAYFYNCDPLSTHTVRTADQIVVLLAMKTLTVVPGLAGLFLACIFSGTLSSVSSGINSMAAVTWEDFVKLKWHNMSQTKVLLLNKTLVALYGLIATGSAFICEYIGGIISAAVAVSALNGPICGLFILAYFVPRANKFSALIGFVVSIVVVQWMCLGNILTQPYAGYRLRPAPATCVNLTNNETTWNDLHYGNDQTLYRISSFLYPLVGLSMVVLVGTPLSYVIRIKDDNKETKRVNSVDLTVF